MLSVDTKDRTLSKTEARLKVLDQAIGQLTSTEKKRK